mmetsp:Transcript_11286/g.47073  ORF Transcript_11286/g.47073 Transcript_11286/m.47073 type:complete len:85 (+) Transcript_11286:674-928(+)
MKMTRVVKVFFHNPRCSRGEPVRSTIRHIGDIYVDKLMIIIDGRNSRCQDENSYNQTRSDTRDTKKAATRAASSSEVPSMRSRD